MGSFQSRLFSALLLLLWLQLSFAAPWKSALDGDDVVQLADSTASSNAEGNSIRVHAWVFERERRPGAITLFAKYLGIDEESLSLKEQAEFEARTRLFFVDVKSKKRMTLHALDGTSVVLQRTDGFGAVSQNVELPVQSGQEGWVHYTVAGPKQSFTGRAQLLPAQGVSIVSDIDDTIRDTHVLNRHEMLMNTFVRPLQAVPAMSALYRQAAKRSSVRFHYVSNAPFALYPLLQRFLRDEQFPEGSTHLRAVSFKGSIWHAIWHKQQGKAHKTVVIETLLQDFPKREFILIGDTGEQDPEIYGDLARRYPDRIRQIALHEVRSTHDGSLDARLLLALRDIPTLKTQVFTEAGALKLDFPEPLQTQTEDP